MKTLLTIILLLIGSYVKAQDTLYLPKGDTLVLENRIDIDEVVIIYLDGILIFDRCRMYLPEGSKILVSNTGDLVGSKGNRNKIKIGDKVVWRGNDEVMTTARAISNGQRNSIILMGAQIILMGGVL